MLADTPRKLLRIMVQFSGHYKRMPTLKELARLSGRTPAGIYSGMCELARGHYIAWQQAQPVESAEILAAWESPEPGKRIRGQAHWQD